MKIASEVYFLQAGLSGPVKIGITKSPVEIRAQELQTGCPWKLFILNRREGTRDDEMAVHQLFSKFWLSGEWFLPDPQVLRFIKSLSSTDFKWPKPSKRLPKMRRPPDVFGPVSQFCMDNIIALATAFTKARGIKTATLSRYIRGDQYFLKDFAAGKVSITLRKYDEIMDWFEDHWPDDTPMPVLREIKELFVQPKA